MVGTVERLLSLILVLILHVLPQEGHKVRVRLAKPCGATAGSFWRIAIPVCFHALLQKDIAFAYRFPRITADQNHCPYTLK